MEAKILIKKEKVKRNITIGGLIVCIGFGLYIAVVDPVAAFDMVAFKLL